MFTKLMQWLLLAGLLFSLWIAIILEQTPVQGLIRKNPFLAYTWPIWLVAAFGIVSLAVIGKRVYDFNNCPEAAEELKEQIKEAKADLKSKGLEL